MEHVVSCDVSRWRSELFVRPVEPHRSRRKHQKRAFPFSPRATCSSLSHRVIIIRNKSSLFVLAALQLRDELYRPEQQDRGVTPEEPQMWFGSLFRQRKSPTAVILSSNKTSGNIMKNLVKMFGVEANTATAEWRYQNVTETQSV